MNRPPPPGAADQLSLEQTIGALSADSDALVSDEVASDPDGSAETTHPGYLDGPPAGLRTADATLARVHLRGGLIALARAELEQMAGAGTLDTSALADLAETRWRSGDLAGAADAAQAHLDAGGIEPMALLIVAEALDAEGHLIDARAIAAQVLERVGGHVDRLFAGEPRSSAWSTAGSIPTPLPPGTVAWGALAGGREIGEPDHDAWASMSGYEPDTLPPGLRTDETGAALDDGALDQAAVLPAQSAPRGTITDLVDAGRAAGRELDAVESAIADGRIGGVPERLALLLRLDRALAPVILSHADQALAVTRRDDPAVPALHLVRGDVFRALGHEAEANAAYQQSLRALAARATTEETT